MNHTLKMLLVVGIALVATALLAAYSDDDDAAPAAGSITINSATGTYTLAGNWVGCSDAGGGTFQKDRFTFFGTTQIVEFESGLLTADCSDATGTGTEGATWTLATDGTKAVSYSTNGTTADPTPPAGLTQPVTVTRLQAIVTATPDGAVRKTLLYVDDRTAVVTLYREHGITEADGYAAFLHAIDTLALQP